MNSIQVWLKLLPITAVIFLSLLQFASSESTRRYMMGKSREIVSASNGMIATSQPLAVLVGLDVLRKGGNAIDAAVAANAMIGLTEPANCGIGGDLFVIYWDAKTQKLYGLNASGRAPREATIEKIKARGLSSIPSHGAEVWTVPGTVDGWAMLLERFGTMPLADLLKPSIEYGESGFPIRGWGDPGEIYHQTPGFKETYMPAGKFPEEGERFTNKALAETYRLIAEGGRDAFYKGALAKQIVEFSKQHGGFLGLSDFEEHRGEWVDPVSTNYRGYDVWELPPNGQGISALQMLNILEGYELAALGHNSAEYLHLLLEAKKLAFADRARFYADPAFYNVPLAHLLSKEYATERRGLIRKDKAMETDPHGEIAEIGDTIYLAAADSKGNMVSFIQSNSAAFGSGWVPDGLGFVLQNRGSMFNLNPEHPNALEPGKRPFHTIIPAFVTKDGKPWLSYGVMGGAMQPQGHVQVLVNILDFGMDIQEAGDAPRVRHLGSSQPWGDTMEQGGLVAYEVGIDPNVIRQLEAMGHRTHPQGSQQFFGGYQAIETDATGTYHGASDPRRAGCAMGF